MEQFFILTGLEIETCQKGGRRGTEPLLQRQKRATWTSLLVSIKQLLKAGVAFNPSNSFNQFVHSFTN
jgi:hypothetical protein